MPGFKTISNTSEITLNDKWTPATKFDSEDRLVDENGNGVSSDYEGHQFRIIEKRERTFSSLERIGRGFLGTVAVVCISFLALFSKQARNLLTSKPLRNLFTKSKENIRFALQEPSIPFISQTSGFSIDQNISNKSSGKSSEPTENVKNVAATIIPSSTQSESALKHQYEETQRVQEEKRKIELEKEITRRDEENLKKAAEEKKATLDSVPLNLDTKKEIEASQVKALTHSEFLTWLKEDTKRLGNEENSIKLISIIKNEEVTEEEIRIFYASLSEFIVLQILSSTQTANSFNAVDEKIIEKALILETNFIQTLNRKCPHKNLDLRTKIEQRTLGPSIFRYSMEEKEIQQIGVEFFEDLRKSGRLLTQQEFIGQGHPQGAYWDKRNDLGRILGANYIERVAEELGLKHIKVPKKIAVANEGVTSLKIMVCPSNLELSSKQITIFAEHITPLSRGTTREEVTEFLKILEATGFGDFFGNNFILGKNQQGEAAIVGE